MKPKMFEELLERGARLQRNFRQKSLDSPVASLLSGRSWVPPASSETGAHFVRTACSRWHSLC